MGLWKRMMNAIRNTPKKLGEEGEEAIALRLERVRFWGYRGKLLRNVYVPKAGGGTTEIDLLYLTKKGVFVVESKNYSGYLFGSESNQYWTESLYAGKNWIGRTKLEKHRFYNPIWQNRTHITHLKRYLPPELPAFSMIVFSDHCTLKEIDYDAPDVVICHQREMVRRLRRIWRRHRSRLTKREVAELYDRLLPFAMADRSTKRCHVRDVRAGRSHAPTCPLCGGTLVLRTAQSGDHAGEQFYGCSNYPRCRYLRDVD